ncbi:hypothetical protein VITU102760_24445 [Vibrio tubiashii]|uniref:Uncharacterized protein n=1 Tax=Vibrio tubiashii ATCC 19109 TaxID=1051646 RepID=F9T5D3_9VIBR|nr:MULTISPECIES: hypothetical protein [Vibrio oreintalis group]AIW17413.1 hypothetical protein IX91_25490 [Vibrio tubiashii ATCC 19109]EGU55330.1 hypothetical protein VITU9109_21329 [Vibrio tubiashii ATCC 19109]EIF04389.1 hypothetical protein VT1337_08481 [Vibrio tubiashii NCIMB 1337 = ATCC 19106]MDC5841090.1 hypothetical protein [Vibrio europaeus]
MWPTSETQSKGFSVAKNSDIRPSDLAKAGFTMLNLRFFPSDLEQVREQIQQRFCDGSLNSNFIVTDESTIHQAIYRFDSCPF